MTKFDAFTLQRSNLNDFLFAEIGVEASGMPLSVLSAFARLDLDPWQEARRLATLPHQAAVDDLAGIIAVASPHLYGDMVMVVPKLVGLLPGNTGREPDPAVLQPSPSRAPLIVQCTVTATLIVLLLASLMSGLVE